MYKSFEEFIPTISKYLELEKFKIEKIDDILYLLRHDKVIIKIYDKSGHGFTFNFSLSKNLHKKHYHKDEIFEKYIYQYLNKEYINNGSDRSIENYNKVINEFKNIIEDIVKAFENDKAIWKHLNVYSLGKIMKNINSQKNPTTAST